MKLHSKYPKPVMPLLPHIGFGHTWHKRECPAHNSFKYALVFLLLPMRAMKQAQQLKANSALNQHLAHNRFGLISFWDCDHGLGDKDSLAWAEQVFAEHGMPSFEGEIWLQTLPRMLGYAFKPVSFWYAIRQDHSLAAVLVEVNNTFGERHCYMLNSPDLAWGVCVKADKCFHVSPFCEDSGQYTFCFTLDSDRVATRIDLTRPDGSRLQTTWTGNSHIASSSLLRYAVFKSPLMTLLVVIRIHWQALKLFAKRVPFFRQPKAPEKFITS